MRRRMDSQRSIPPKQREILHTALFPAFISQKQKMDLPRRHGEEAAAFRDAQGCRPLKGRKEGSF